MYTHTHTHKQDDKDPLSLAKELGHTEIITFIEMRGTTATERDVSQYMVMGKLDTFL